MSKEGFFGPAAEPMRAYFDLIHDKVKDPKLHMHLYSGLEAGYLTPDVVQEMTRLFDQAEERAAAARDKEKMKPIILSRLEEAHGTTRIQDLHTATLEEYQDVTDATDLSDGEFHRRLLLQGLLKEQEGILSPTGFGRKYSPSTVLTDDLLSLERFVDHSVPWVMV